MRRAVVGGVAGLVVVGVSAVAALFRSTFAPRVTGDGRTAAFAAMALFAVLFAVAGACIAHLATVRYRIVRYLAIGALAGALAWSYFTATWPITSKLGSVVEPQFTTAEAALTGGGAGALGGLLLLLIGWIRSGVVGRDRV